MLISALSSLLYRSTRRPRLRLVSERVTRLMIEIENRRNHYRVVFPPEIRPRLLLDGPGAAHAVLEVLECSERGLRFAPPVRWQHPPGAQLSGRLMFARGAEAHVAGTVQRVETGSVALLLNRRGIPLGTILDEQRYIRAHFNDGA